MRTVIVYHNDGTKSTFTDNDAKSESARCKIEREEDHKEKVNFHNNILKGCYDAECDGKMNMSRREADFHKMVHKAAAECGGDLPAFGPF